MPLSKNDLCSRFGVAQATVDRWVRQGKIPAFSKNGSLWFRQKDIEKWAARQNIQLNQSDRPDDTTADNIPTLAQAFDNGAVYYDVAGPDKDAVLNTCIRQMALIPEDFRQDLFDRIKEREAAMSTGIGNGIAIPHPREPLSYLPRSAVVTCFLTSPVDFDALDGRPVSMVFFLLSTSLTHHLPLLSALSRCLKNSRVLAAGGARPDPDLLINELRTLAG